MGEDDLLLRFIAQRIETLHADFRTDLAKTENRLLTEISRVAATCQQADERITQIEQKHTRERGFIAGVSAITALVFSLLAFVLRALWNA